MSENNNFIDPLDALINQHLVANGEEPKTEAVVDNNPTIDTEAIAVDTKEQVDPIEVDYGDNDLDAEIKAEEERDEQLRQEALKIKHEAEAANAKNQLPPRSLDPDFQAEAIGYQGEKLEIVAGMVNSVLSKHNITNGQVDPEKQQHIMGELIDIYHNTGTEITPEFENIILSNWITTVAEDSDETSSITVSTNDDVANETTGVQDNTTPAVEQRNINITVEKNTPVTVNVDESIVGEMKTTQALNIYVKEVSEKDLKATTIIENSNKEGIIKPYDSGVNDVPITLPMSAYRCVMRPINWFAFIKLSAPTSNNPADLERKKWSVIYDHMKNVSIGEFANFEDFLKKTKYSDRELLMWAILVGTADEEETLTLNCSNPKCKQQLTTKYHPRNIIRLDEKRIPKYYKALHDAPFGEESYKIWEEVAGSRRRYELPNTKIIVEINEPSAYEFITQKLSLTQELYERYRPGEKMGSVDINTPEFQSSMMEFEYIAGNALMVSAMSIPDKDDPNKEYRYTNWEDIESIITTALDAEDSAILLQIVSKARDMFVSPVTFKLDDLECNACKHMNKDLYITDIADSLLFQVSRRLANTNVNLIEMP